MEEGHDLFVEVGEAGFAAVGGDDAVVTAQVSVLFSLVSRWVTCE